MRQSLQRIVAITAKEVRQLARDRITFGMIVGIPLLQITLFGYAINLDVRHLPAAVADRAGTQLSRQLVADTAATQVVDIVARVRSAEELEELRAVVDDRDRATAEFGDLLFAAVNLGRHLDIDPEIALSRTNDRFVERFRVVEELAEGEGRRMRDMDLAELDRLWAQVEPLYTALHRASIQADGACRPVRT